MSKLDLTRKEFDRLLRKMFEDWDKPNYRLAPIKEVIDTPHGEIEVTIYQHQYVKEENK